MILTHLPSYIDEESGIFPPLGLMYLASSLSNKTGINVEILDALLNKISLNNIANKITNYLPDLVGITATSFTLIDALLIAKTVKEVNQNIHVTMGGPHVSIYPNETLLQKDVDSVVIGEGEKTFSDLVNNLNEGKNLEGIPGLAFKNKQGQIINNGYRDFIENLDEIPLPDRNLTPYKEYYSILGEKHPITTIITSRGCPFRCSFCYHFLGKKWRTRSAKNVIEELESCVNIGIREFWFFDETFTIDKKRVLDICDGIISKKLNIKWNIRSRVDTIDKNMMERLKLAGCEKISFGIESALSKTLKVLQKEINPDKSKEIVLLAKSLGFETSTDFMIGSPGETREDILETISFSLKLDPDYATFSITTPFPCTQLYNSLLENKFFDRDYWKDFSISPSKDFIPNLCNEYLSREELAHLQNYAYKKFYLRPKYILKKMLKLKSPIDFLRKAKVSLRMLASREK